MKNVCVIGNQINVWQHAFFLVDYLEEINLLEIITLSVFTIKPCYSYYSVKCKWPQTFRKVSPY